jgi:purine-binding chemotaxis protein CheW
MDAKEGQQMNSGSNALLQVVSFDLGDEVFAIDIFQVQEIIRMLEITKVPNTPVFVEGVINLRGKVIPVVDLRKRFHLPVKEDNPQERIIVAKIHNKPVGMIVDEVSEVLRFSRKTVEPTPSLLSEGIDSQSVAGVAKVQDRLLILLDLDNFLTTSEQKQL